MSFHHKPRYTTRYFVSAALAAALVSIPVSTAGFLPHVAQAQAQEPIDFRAALEGYGHWIRHPRWGEVWIPDERGQDWQPYRVGHWVFTDEWGWYWDSDEDFGWVTYHYGRWLLDRDLGWIWRPDDEWAPAWVNWRQGDDFVGWAPQPPDEYIDEDENPEMYMFVRAGDLLAPEVYSVLIPRRERLGYFGRSRIVNRTFRADGRRFGVNPGIPPAFIAHSRGRPFHSVSVAPIVLGGTVGVAGAVILRNGFHDRGRTRIKTRETQRIVQPTDHFQKLQPLQKGERGRLGGMKLKAVQGGTPASKTDGGRKDLRSPSNSPSNSVTPSGRNGVEQKRGGPRGNQPNDRGTGNQKRIEDDKKGFEQKNIQQKTSPQDSRSGSPRNSGSNSNHRPQNLQRNDQRQNIQPHNTQPKVQNNPQPKVQQQNVQPRVQQHNAQPRVQQQQHRNPPPQRGRQQDQNKQN